MGSEKSLPSSSSRGFAMRIKAILPFVVALGDFHLALGSGRGTTEAGQRWGETVAEATAKAAYDAAEKAAKAAEAAVAP